MSLERPQIWWNIDFFFCQNYYKETNVGFCDNSIDRSLGLILKYIVYEFYGCANGKLKYFEKNIFNLFLKKTFLLPEIFFRNIGKTPNVMPQ